MGKAQCSIEDCGTVAFCRGWCRKHYTRWYETGSTELGVRKRGNFRPVRPLEERFWEKVQKTETCWLWTGGATTLGYGMIWSGPGGRQLMAHRVAWELLRGPIADGLHIDHLCRTPSCVNPDHLEPVTRAVNASRGYAGSMGAARQLAKTHCPQGHPYDEANTHINKRGARMCRTCIRIRQRAQRQARRDGVPYVDPFLLDSGS